MTPRAERTPKLTKNFKTFLKIFVRGNAPGCGGGADGEEGVGMDNRGVGGNSAVGGGAGNSGGGGSIMGRTATHTISIGLQNTFG